MIRSRLKSSDKKLIRWAGEMKHATTSMGMAAKRLGMVAVPAIRLAHLTEAQAQRHPGIEAAGELADQFGREHQG